jgi:hypothetical protein
LFFKKNKSAILPNGSAKTCTKQKDGFPCKSPSFSCQTISGGFGISMVLTIFLEMTNISPSTSMEMVYLSKSLTFP